MMHGFRTPVTALQQHERRAVENASDTRETRAEDGDHPVNAGDCHDLTDRVGERELVADHAGERETAEIKNEHIFEWSELLAGTAAGNATNENEETVAPDGSE